jgi:hypothetical protein
MANTTGQKFGGRVAGTPNKTTKLVRETIAEVFDLMQQDDKTSLLTWSQNNPDDFYKIVAPKIIPNQLTVEQSVSFVPILPKEVAEQFPENTDAGTEDI